MALNFTKLKKRPLVFKQLSGLGIKEFEEVVERIREAWEKREAQKKCDGRSSHLATLEDKVLCLLIYYRTYISQFFLGYLFNLHSSNVSRLFKKLEPLLAKKTAIKKNRELTSDKVLELLVDVTEQRTQRPKNNQDRRKSYSGKKKACTIKTEIVIEKNGKIVSISKSHKGRTHDFRIRKEEKILPPSAIKYADSGYQGFQKIQSQVVIPYKRYRKKPLTLEQKEHNKALASFRMKVENKFRELKIFKILADVYRNFQKKYPMRFNSIAGLVNLKHGF